MQRCPSGFRLSQQGPRDGFCRSSGCLRKTRRTPEAAGCQPIKRINPFAHLPANGPDAEEFTARCRKRGLFLRNAAGMGTGLGDRAVRIAVKDAITQRQMLETMRTALTLE